MNQMDFRILKNNLVLPVKFSVQFDKRRMIKHALPFTRSTKLQATTVFNESCYALPCWFYFKKRKLYLCFL